MNPSRTLYFSFRTEFVDLKQMRVQHNSMQKLAKDDTPDTSLVTGSEKETLHERNTRVQLLFGISITRRF